MPRREAQAIRDAVAMYALDPGDPKVDVRRVVGGDGYRLRVGGWRCLFEVDAEAELIRVYLIRRRGDVYNR